eukprot:GGOE01001501.1.p1 GENE.GGOE01001501.1~~GGOE01001501.1.p1  ORF type:complete len:598 (+),score=109.22 GGOE01001501.1:62-1855(+)
MHRFHKKDHDSRKARGKDSLAAPQDPRSDLKGSPPGTQSTLTKGVYVEPNLQYLSLRVFEAELANLKANGAKGIYVQVELQGQETVTMAKPIKKESDFIQWNEELMLSKLQREDGAKVVISVMQCFSMSKDRPIFTIEIPVSQIPVINSDVNSEPKGQWYSGGETRSRVFLACWFDQAFERPIRPVMGQLTVSSVSANFTSTSPIQFNIDDPSTLLTIAFFDDDSNCVFLGAVRIRTSVLPIGREFQTTQPLYVRKSIQMGLQTTLQKMGQVTITVRRDHGTATAVYLGYLQPVLPPKQYTPKYLQFRSILLKQQVEILAEFLERCGLPSRATLVLLNADGEQFTVAESRIHLKRLMDVVEKIGLIKQGFMAIIRWDSFVKSLLANAVWVWLVYNPLEVVQAALVCIVLLLVWTACHHRAVVSQSVVMDPSLFKMTEVDNTEDEGQGADDEGSEVPEEGFSHLAVSRRPMDILLTKTARVLSGGFKTQSLWAYIATFFERIIAIVQWQDATATLMVLGAVVLTLLWLIFLPFDVQHALAFLGVYGMRHPRLRKHRPPAVMSFFERLPSRQDRIVPDGVGTKHRLQHIRNLALAKHVH